MARTALKVKTQRNLDVYEKALKLGKKPKNATKVYHRCLVCGRGRGYLGLFKICRICFRERASKGEMVGIRKASW